MVGDDEMYGSFSNFQDIIAAAQFSENWYYNFDEAEHIYQAQIIVDTFSLEYAWAIDTVPPTPTKLYLSPVFSVYPNPSKEDVTLSFNQNESIHVKVVNPVGLEIFSKKYDYDPVAPVKLKTNNWEEGVYFIIIESKGKSYKQKMIKL